MEINKFKVEFEYSSDTKNNYIFAQKKGGGVPQMFPPKIYLNKELFGNKEPVGVELSFRRLM